MMLLAAVCTGLLCAAHVWLGRWTWYLGLLTWRSKLLPARVPNEPLPRFVLVVPAHNEASHIEKTVQSLLSVSYPRQQYQVLVVADNCNDNTAQLAEQAGAKVLLRQDAQLRGKGYALAAAFNQLASQEDWDALVIVDADTIVSANLLTAFAGGIQQGALALQADYGVSNGLQSWRTKLMVIALAMFHRVRSLGREHLQLSCGFRGNGMCLTKQVLQQVPYQAFGLVEDVEYGIALGRAGIRIVYVDEAHVLGEMVSSSKASESQRLRWEQGRAKLEQEILPTLAQAAWQTRSWLLADLAYDIYVPPLARIVVWTVWLGLVTLAAAWVGQGPVWLAGALLLTHSVALGSYLLRGIWLSGLGVQAFSALLWAPMYVFWKMTLGRRSAGGKEEAWVRTAREGDGGARVDPDSKAPKA